MHTNYEHLRINVDPMHVARLLPFKAKIDIRYYLQGISVEKAPDGVGGVYLAATDGHTLAVIHDATGSIEGEEKVIVTVTPACAAAIKTSGMKRNAIMKHRFLVKGQRVMIAPGFDSEGTASEHFIQTGRAIIEGQYPDWRKIIPDFTKLKRGAMTGNAVNPLYIGRIAQMNGGKYGGGVVMWQEDPQKAIVCQVTGVPELIVLVMPMRQGGDDQQISRSLLPRFPFAVKPEAPPVAMPSDAEPVPA